MASGFKGGGGVGGGPIPPGSITNVEIANNTIINNNMDVNSVKGHGAPGPTVNVVVNTIQGQAPGGAAASDIKPLSLNGSGPGGPGTGDVAPGSLNTPELKDGAVTLAKMDSAALPNANYLNNPGFVFAQLYNPAAPFNVLNDAVGPDCWKSAYQAADLQYTRQDSNGTAIRAPYSARYTKLTAPGQFLIYQGIEAKLSRGLRGVGMNFQFLFRSSIALPNMHIMLLNYSGGTPDMLPTPLVTAWNVPPVPPTFDPAVSVITDFPTGLIIAGNTYLFGAFGTPPATMDNLIVAIWPELIYPVVDNLEIWEPGLFAGFGIRPWNPLPFTEDLQRVERFIEKSYDTDTVPNTPTITGSVGGVENGANNQLSVPFRERKPKTAGISFYNPNGGPIGTWRDTTGAADVLVGAVNVGEAGFQSLMAGGVDGNTFIGHYVADASL